MSFVNSSSTDAQVWAAFDDNASYDAAGSSANVQAFIVACRILLRRLPQMQQQQGVSQRNNPEMVETALNQAVVWQASNPNQNSVRPGGVGYFSFANARD